MRNKVILIVEDEPNLGQTLQEYLSAKGHQCQWARTAQEARLVFQDGSVEPFIVLMDIGLPDGDGLALAREFRQQRKDFVLLFLSALNDPNTRLEGLELGAEDYITKPFELKELTLRLSRILKNREYAEQVPDEIALGPLKIWFKRFEVIDGQGQVLALSQKECGILELLYQNLNNVVSRDDIIDQVWGMESFPSNRTVDNYIVKLRKWSESDSTGQVSITTVRGIGYRLTYSPS